MLVFSSCLCLSASDDIATLVGRSTRHHALSVSLGDVPTKKTSEYLRIGAYVRIKNFLKTDRQGVVPRTPFDKRGYII